MVTSARARIRNTALAAAVLAPGTENAVLRPILSVFEPFILILVGTVALASVLPPGGSFAPIIGGAA